MMGALALGRLRGPSLSCFPMVIPTLPQRLKSMGQKLGLHYPLWVEGFSRSLSSQLKGAGMTGETEARGCPGFCYPPHCGVILAASARMRAMRSWLMRKTNLRLAIWTGKTAQYIGGTGHPWTRLSCTWHAPSPTHLHHRVVAKPPLGTTQHRPAIDIDRPPAFIGNEEVTIVFQLDDTCRGRKENE